MCFLLLSIMEIYPEIYPCFQNSSLFVAEYQALRCMHVPQVVYPFTCKKTFRLLAGLGYYRYNCSVHLCYLYGHVFVYNFLIADIILVVLSRDL